MSATKADMDELMRLAMWARQHGFLIRDVEVGSVKLRIADLRIAAQEGLRQSDPEASIWKEHGADDPDDDMGGTIG